MICLNDLFATCADILGKELPPDAAEDSVSVLPALISKNKGLIREATVHHAPAGLAIRQGDWKLIALRNGTKELYNLKGDLSETRNLIDSKQGESQRLEKLLKSYIAKGRSTPGPAQKNEFDFSWDKEREPGKSKKNKKNTKPKK